VPLTLSHSKKAMSCAHIFATASVARVSFEAAYLFAYALDGHFEILVEDEAGIAM
jgi:hypothetical protein